MNLLSYEDKNTAFYQHPTTMFTAVVFDRPPEDFEIRLMKKLIARREFILFHFYEVVDHAVIESLKACGLLNQKVTTYITVFQITAVPGPIPLPRLHAKYRRTPRLDGRHVRFQIEVVE